MLNDASWIKYFKEKGLTYGVSQNKLAVAADITRQYLNKIESGSAAPSEELKENLLQALKRYNPETSLTMLFDYVRIRFLTTDVRFVVETILKL
ncbi:helix-turn-helix domain-containing protein [Longibaculum muris]